ncbi:hypothetical protein ACHAWF_001936, partial [Thalassiosira exigua]
MATKSSQLMLLIILYAIIVIIAISNRLMGEVSSQLRKEGQIDESFFRQQKRVDASTRTPRNATISNQTHGAPNFPIKKHIVTQGSPRTATTLLFNMVAVSYFLHLVEHDPHQISRIKLVYWKQQEDYTMILRKAKSPRIIKTHLSLDNFRSKNSVVFTAAEDKKEAATMKRNLEHEGHTVAFVQDMKMVKSKGGLYQLVQEYVAGYGLSEKDEANLMEYFSMWQVLRQCCGQQMSKHWRNDMMPKQFKDRYLKSHLSCASYDIDSIEQTFMNTEIYAMIQKYQNIQSLNKPSLNDPILNGTYCSSYNDLIRTQGLNFWGNPGGKHKESKLDGAIKEQMKLGRSNLKQRDAYLLFPSSNLPLSVRMKIPLSVRMKKMCNLTEEEKKEWLKAVLAARESGEKSYSDYSDIPSAGDSSDAREEAGEGSIASAESTRIEQGYESIQRKSIEGHHRGGGGDRSDGRHNLGVANVVIGNYRDERNNAADMIATTDGF